MQSYQTSSPYTASGSYESTSPTTPSHLPSPASSYTPSSPASNCSGNGCGTDGSAPQTPQSPLPVVVSTGTKEGTITPETIHEHYMNLTRRLTGQQNRDVLLTSPDHHPSSTITDADRGAAAARTMVANANTDMMISEMGPTLEELIADSAQVLDWLPLDHWTMMPAGTMTLDELPDSPNRTRPEYQLTQEWYEQTLRCLREEEGEANVSGVEAEMEVDGGRC